MAHTEDTPKQSAASSDSVNHPPHYNRGPIEVIEIIEGFNLGFHLGNTVKYILRADHKGKRTEDLKKAQWYLAREIANAAKSQSSSENDIHRKAGKSTERSGQGKRRRKAN